MHKKILVVDDDFDIIEPLTLILKSKNFEVETTTKGELVYSKISSFKPDILLLDIRISGSDGREICKRLKKNKRTKQLIVIMMSAHPHAKKYSEEIGADNFIAKPFEIEELLSTVGSYL